MAKGDQYIIRAKIVVDDAKMRPGVRRAKRRIKEVETQGIKSSVSISKAFGRAFAFIGGAAGAGLAIKGIANVNAEIQNAEVSIGGLFNAINGLPIGQAMLKAKGVVKDLRRDAAVGVGELQDYMLGFNQIFAPAVQAGLGTEQIRELTKLALTAGFVQRQDEGLKLAPLDVTQALTQGLGERTTPIALLALRAIDPNIEVQDFNALSKAERATKLFEAFSRYNDSAEMVGNTWMAQSDTFKDNVIEAVRSLTGPMFDRWTNGLISVNKWLEANRSEIDSITNKAGKSLLRMWESINRQVALYVALVATAGASAVGGTAVSAGKKVGHHAKWFGLQAIALGPMTAIKTLFKLFSRVAGPVGVLFAVISSVFGAIKEAPVLGAILVNTLSELMGQFMLLGESFAMLNSEGSVLNMLGAVLILIFAGLIESISFFVKIISSLVTGLAVMFRIIGEGLLAIAAVVTGDWGAVRKSPDKMLDVLNEGNALLKDIWIGDPPKVDLASSLDDLNGGLEGKKSPNVNIGKVEIYPTVEVNEDPTRVAFVMSDVLEKLARNKKQAKRVPTLGN